MCSLPQELKHIVVSYINDTTTLMHISDTLSLNNMDYLSLFKMSHPNQFPLNFGGLYTPESYDWRELYVAVIRGKKPE